MCVKWFDTHTHLDCEPLFDNLENVFKRAANTGVVGFIIPGIRGQVLKKLWPDNVYLCWGIHPGNSVEFSPNDVMELFSKCDYKPIAIGECGLDINYEIPLSHQEAIFIEQLKIASARKLPVVLHLRGAWNTALSLLSKYAPNIPWILHTFSGSWEIAELFLRKGAFISFSAALCRSNARKTPRVASLVQLDRILLETDSPDIPPPDWPYSFNEPSSLPIIGRRLAELRGISVEELAFAVMKNVTAAFGVSNS